jgi:predicted MFS family arabinose efflux permease
MVTAMGSVGQFVLVPTTRSLIEANGWRATAVALAAVVAVVAVLAPVLRGRAADQQGPNEPGHDPVAVPLRDELRRAAHSRSFLLLNAAFFVCGFHVTFIATHLVSYAGDVGVGAGPASTGLAVIGLFNIAGSLVAGYLGSRYLKSHLLSWVYGLRAVVITAFILVPPSEVTVVVFGAMIGLLWLATVPLTGGIVTSQFGTTHSGTLFGLVFLSHQLGAFVGAWMGGELADRSGSYTPVWWIAVALGVMAALLHLVIDEGPAAPPPPRLAGWRLAPAGGVAVMAIAVAGAAGLGAAAEPAAADQGSGSVPATYFCVLHPVTGG